MRGQVKFVRFSCTPTIYQVWRLLDERRILLRWCCNGVRKYMQLTYADFLSQIAIGWRHRPVFEHLCNIRKGWRRRYKRNVAWRDVWVSPQNIIWRVGDVSFEEGKVQNRNAVQRKVYTTVTMVREAHFAKTSVLQLHIINCSVAIYQECTLRW